MESARYLAVRLVDKTFKNNGYSNIMLDSALKNSGLKLNDMSLCSVIYYGVIERKITLDHIIGEYSSRSLNKLDSIILNILRCGIYQIMYMDNIPDNAAVNESVNLAKQFGKTSAAGMVNAVLRSFIRSGRKYSIPDDETKMLSVKYSAPKWLVESLISDYGRELAENLLFDSFGQPPLYIRLNSLVFPDDDSEFINSWGGRFSFEKSEKVPYCYKVSGSYPLNPTSSDMFDMGWFHVQDLASQLCCKAVSPTENDLVLDMCAAPGGKTFTMAEMMNGKGMIYAFDLHENRVNLIRNGAAALSLGNITAGTGDATVFNPNLPKFTKILCDVPCSGIGAIRRKPEIKYKSLSELERLPEIQYNIARNALNYLDVGGELVYSTCTLRCAENDEVCERLLREHPELEPITLPEPLGGVFGSRASIFPKHFGSDGFFIAKFRKIR